MRSSLSIALVALGGLLMLACGGSDSGENRGGGGMGGTGGTGITLDCSTLDPRPADCDKDCTSSAQCEASFCNNGKCVAHCTATQGCGSNSTCNVSGRCVPNMNTGGTGGTGGTGNTGGGNSCQSVSITPTRSIPNVMFLVDQSYSMNADDFGPNDDKRWTAAHDAITSIISRTESIVRFGLTTYTSDNGNRNPPCPRLPTQVDFDLDNSGPIGSAFPASYPNQYVGYTPTGDSINSLVGLIQASPPPAEGPTIIVLATDGEPNSCVYPNPNDSHNPQYSRELAVSAAANAHTAKMDLFVLWVGELTSSSIRAHLQEVADAGTTGPGIVYVGDDPTSLSSAFQSIISASISCDVQMDDRFDDKMKACAEGVVKLNGGAPLACSDTNGWRVKLGVDDVIELVGSACDTFKGGDVTVSAEFPCGAIIVVE
jgi:hypothetical protein